LNASADAFLSTLSLLLLLLLSLLLLLLLLLLPLVLLLLSRPLQAELFEPQGRAADCCTRSGWPITSPACIIQHTRCCCPNP
jgi:ABC-type transport system involved in cytochrome bd biosynthesis fused ATPase/permease subunit